MADRRERGSFGLELKKNLNPIASIKTMKLESRKITKDDLGEVLTVNGEEMTVATVHCTLEGVTENEVLILARRMTGKSIGVIFVKSVLIPIIQNGQITYKYDGSVAHYNSEHTNKEYEELDAKLLKIGR